MRIDYAEVRALLRQSRSGALGTHSVAMAGFPFVSAVPFVADALGRPAFLLSGLAEHTRNLLADPRASLLVTDGDWQGASARLDARVCGFEITGHARPGFGRIGKVQLTYSVSGRAGLTTVAQ